MKKIINKVLREETRGLKKGFDRKALIFSYDDVVEILDRTFQAFVKVSLPNLIDKSLKELEKK
jgi:hypothetical protein